MGGVALNLLAKPPDTLQSAAMVPFSFAGEEWRLSADRALFRPRDSALLLADLHLEKASFYATHGQMLPPYDSRATLERVALAIRETGARRVFCLGDNFHDDDGPARLEPHAAGMLAALTRAVEWVWITGNHDAGAEAAAGGALVDQIEIGGVILRHRAQRGETRPELSGHYHPKLRLSVRGKRIVRPCLVASFNEAGGRRMILPAFGALTGGMDAADPAILAAMQPAHSIDALVATGARIAHFPLWRAAA
jgi:DNA ligase-associated metallophosphoesterase